MKKVLIDTFQSYLPKSISTLALSEFTILMVVYFVGMGIFIGFPIDESLVADTFFKAFLFAFSISISMTILGLYWDNSTSGLFKEILHVIIGFLPGILMLELLFYLFPMWFDNAVIINVTSLGFIGVISIRILHHFAVVQQALQPKFLILGAGKKAQQIKKQDFPGITIANFITEDEQADIFANDLNHAKQRKSLIRIAEENNAKTIVVALDERRKHFPTDELIECKMHGITVIDLTDFFELYGKQIRIADLTPSTIIFSTGFRTAILAVYSKRMFDIIASFSGLILSAPIMLLAAIAILVESRGSGPIIYRQCRVGKNEDLFEVLKFRTMCVDAEKSGQPKWAERNDPRVTWVGRILRNLRIDELPQLVNVLKGEMSFVGPRPERPEFVKQLSTRIPYYRLRHRIKPGITGWAQISYPYGASEQDAIEKLQYDLYYMKNYSILLDLIILLQTAHTILWRRGAR